MNEPNTTNQPQPPSGGAGISAFEEAAAELLWLDLAEKASSSPFLSGLIICQSCKNTLTRNIILGREAEAMTLQSTLGFATNLRHRDRGR